MSITVQQDATIYSSLHFCKLLYMFLVVIPPVISSTYNCNYNIWHWSYRLWNSSNCSTIAEGTRDGLTSARCCNCSYMCSWWWVDLPPETCRAVYRNIINCIYSNKSTNQMHQSFRFIACRLNIAQYVSGILMSIIRSLSTAVAASGLPLEHCYHHVPTVNQRRLLQLISSWWWAWGCPKPVELYLNDRQ